MSNPRLLATLDTLSTILTEEGLAGTTHVPLKTLQEVLDTARQLEKELKVTQRILENTFDAAMKAMLNLKAKSAQLNGKDEKLIKYAIGKHISNIKAAKNGRRKQRGKNYGK